MKKEPETFIDENGELCRWATFKESLVFSLVFWIGLFGLVAVLWWSRTLYHSFFNP
jgi:hypothetical protein